MKKLHKFCVRVSIFFNHSILHDMVVVITMSFQGCPSGKDCLIIEAFSTQFSFVLASLEAIVVVSPSSDLC